MDQDQNQPTQKSGSNKTVMTVIIIVVVVFVALGIGGYFVSQYFAKKAASALLDTATGGKVKTDGDDSAALNFGDLSVKTGNLASWPTDLPVALAAPEDVKIASSSKITSSQTWLVNISEIPTNTIDNYVADLKEKGWTQTDDVNVFVRMITLTKDSWKLTIGYDEANRTAQLTVSPK